MANSRSPRKLPQATDIGAIWFETVSNRTRELGFAWKRLLRVLAGGRSRDLGGSAGFGDPATPFDGAQGLAENPPVAGAAVPSQVEAASVASPGPFAPPDPATQVDLITQGLSSGADVGALVRGLVADCDDSAVLWQISDVLEANRRGSDAALIYERLMVRPATSEVDWLLTALAASRLGDGSRALDLLEAGLDSFPECPELLQHYTELCVQRLAHKRFLRFHETRRAAGMTAPAVPPAFVLQTKVDLITASLDEGAQVTPMVRALLEDFHDGAALWGLADALEARQCISDAAIIYKHLMARPAVDPQDWLRAALAATRLGRTRRALDLFEAGLDRFPRSPELFQHYTGACARQAARVRYTSFLESRESAGVPAPLPPREYILTGMIPPRDIVTQWHNIAGILDERELDQVQRDVIQHIHLHPQSVSAAQELVRLSRMLGLPADFNAELVGALQANCPGGTTVARSLEILDRGTPPFITDRAADAAAQVRLFIDSCRSLARDQVRLGEPIADVGTLWAPWQSLFSLGVPELYGQAMGAFEELAFATWPKLNFAAGHGSSDVQQRTDRPLRVGFIALDAMPMMSGLLSHLDGEKFETFFLRPGNMGRSAAAQQWVERADTVVQYSDVDMYDAIQTIADVQLDIIVSCPSVGTVLYPMLARLAPLQLVLLEPNWTDGLTNADYYVSWRTAEPAKPSAYYQSKVALLQHPPYWLERPDTGRPGPMGAVERAAIRSSLLSAGDEERIYLCASTPPKISPEMDGLIREILARDAQARIVLLRGDSPYSVPVLARLGRSLGSDIARVTAIGTLGRQDAHSLLEAVDCCLDSVPMCGMSSSFDATMLGVPIVTMPSDVPFGSWTAAIYEYLGVTGLTARSREEYCELALSLASDPDRRNQLGRDIWQRSEALLQNEAGSQEFASFLLAAWERHRKGLPPADWVDGRF